MPVLFCPVGNKCNLSCVYCYEAHQGRENNLKDVNYDPEILIPILEKQRRPFSIFGGEPLLIPEDGLEEIFKIGFSKFAYNSIQTNGTLINEEHVRMFKKYNVHVGFSIDGPGNLNDLRWAGTTEKTLEMTRTTEANIWRLCEEGIHARLIVTLHRKNASKQVINQLKGWFKSLYDQGVRHVRLHLMQSNSNELKENYALSSEEAIEVLFELEKMESVLGETFFDIFHEVRLMLRAIDKNASCTWRGCDVYNTPSVDIVGPRGEITNCERSKKGSTSYSKTKENSYERCISLYQTEQRDGGCKGCRFFIACKGHCPSMAIDGDWRNRSECCDVWKALFTFYENKMLEQGKYPISILMNRENAEKKMLEAWYRGENPSLEDVVGKSWFAATALEDCKQALPEFYRVAWTSTENREVWENRLKRIFDAMPEIAEGISSQNAIEYKEEIGWLEELKAMKMEVSSRHGITEIVTPMFKACFNSI